MRKHLLLITLLVALITTLAACGAPATPTPPPPPTEAPVAETEETDAEAEATEPDAEAAEAEAEADVAEADEEADASDEEAVVPAETAETDVTMTAFEPGVCQIHLMESVTAVDAVDDDTSEGTIPAGVYGVTALFETADNTFLALPLADGREVVIEMSTAVVPDETCGLDIAEATSSMAASSDATESTLTGVVWQWVGTVTPVEAIEVDEPASYTILFNEDGTAEIVADCNGVGAEYTAEDSNIAIELGMGTLIFCGEDSLDETFKQQLSEAAIYFFDEEGNLFMDMPMDSGTMQFTAQTAMVDDEMTSELDLTGVVWQWTQTTTPVEVIAVDNPENYTIQFNEDGTANIKADCNVVGATYTTGEEGFSINLGPSTMAFCGEESLDQVFLEQLSMAAIPFMEDGNLYIDMPMDSGTMQFTAQETAAEEAPVLTDVVWQWTQTTTPVEVIEVDDPASYTILFNEDGTAEIVADCNGVGAEYTAEDGAISIELGAGTLAFCGEDSLDETFKQQLSEAAIYFFDEEGDLFMDMPMDSGTMQFTAVEEPTLTDVVWQWVGTVTPVEAIEVDDPASYTILFNEDGTAEIVADCNGVGAEYTAEDGAISIELGAGTLAFCGEDSLDETFKQQLSEAVIYFFDEEGNLFMDMPMDSGTMQFTAQTAMVDDEMASELDLTGVVWEWTQTTTPVEVTEVDNPENYTIQFNEDGTANITADCNVVGATYTTGEEGFSINLGPSTMAFCGEESLDQVFLEQLSTAAIPFMEDGNLYIDMPMDSGTMRFEAATN